MSNKYQVSVYGDDDKVIARVQYNSILDFWDGHNWTCGSGAGHHKGITKLKDGRYVIINGTDWQGERDKAHVISKEQALQEILKSNHVELLKTKKFKELKELYKTTNQEEL